MADKAEHLNKKQKVGISVGASVGGALVIAGITLALLFGCKKTPVYEITWTNYNDKVLRVDKVKKNEIPEYHGRTPTKPQSDSETFTFAGWSPRVVAATKDATYKARYTAETRTFTVRIVDRNGYATLTSDTVENVPYGTVIRTLDNRIEILDTTIYATVPWADHYYDYHFDGWSVDDFYVITGDTEIECYTSRDVRYYDLKLTATNCVIEYNGVDYEDVSVLTGETPYEYRPVRPSDADTSVRYATDPTLTLKYYHLDGSESLHTFKAKPLDDQDYYDYTFDGWYSADNRVSYSTRYMSNKYLEARYTKTLIDSSDLFNFEIDTINGTASIIGMKSEYMFSGGSYPNVVFPETYEGYPVVAVKGRALSNIPGIENVYISKNIEMIEESTLGAFAGNIVNFSIDEENHNFAWQNGILYNGDFTEVLYSSLNLIEKNGSTEVVLPSTVTRIWSHAFASRQITEIVLPSSLTSIERYAFYETSITHIEIPVGVTEIDIGTLCNCQSLTSVELPNNLISIGGSAFAGCTQLDAILIPANVQSINFDSFKGCTSLASLIVDDENKAYASYDNVLYTKNFETLIFCPAGLTEPLEFPSQLRNIGQYAFFGSQIMNLRIAEGVETINYGAFQECHATDIYLPNSILTLNGYLFFDSKVEIVHFNGTTEEWDAVNKSSEWKGSSLLLEVDCTDMTINV